MIKTLTEIADYLREDGHGYFAARLVKYAESHATLLESLEELLPYAEKFIDDLVSQMLGGLYPAINEAKIRRGKAAIAIAKTLTGA